MFTFCHENTVVSTSTINSRTSLDLFKDTFTTTRHIHKQIQPPSSTTIMQLTDMPPETIIKIFKLAVDEEIENGCCLRSSSFAISRSTYVAAIDAIFKNRELRATIQTSDAWDLLWFYDELSCTITSSFLVLDLYFNNTETLNLTAITVGDTWTEGALAAEKIAWKVATITARCKVLEMLTVDLGLTNQAVCEGVCVYDQEQHQQDALGERERRLGADHRLRDARAAIHAPHLLGRL